jgi:hypothetical protein
MQSGENDVCDVTLSLRPHMQGKLKSLPDHGGNRIRDLLDTSPIVYNVCPYMELTVKTNYFFCNLIGQQLHTISVCVAFKWKVSAKSL